jgi:hypothetical protein
MQGPTSRPYLLEGNQQEQGVHAMSGHGSQCEPADGTGDVWGQTTMGRWLRRCIVPCVADGSGKHVLNR